VSAADDPRAAAMAVRVDAVRRELDLLDDVAARLDHHQRVVVGRRIVAVRAEADQIEAEVAAMAAQGAGVVSPGSYMVVVRAHLDRRRTWRVRVFELWMRRRACRGELTAHGLAELAAARSVLLERGVDVPDAGQRPSLRPALVSAGRSLAGVVAVVVLVAVVVATVIAALSGAGLDTRP
jgi:hypothetical protein